MIFSSIVFRKKTPALSRIRPGKTPGLLLCRTRISLNSIKKERFPAPSGLIRSYYILTKARIVDLAALTDSNWASVMVMIALPSDWQSVGRVS